MLEKHKPIRLHGDKLRELNGKIYNRDNNSCVLCGAYVPEGTKFHHIDFKSQGGSDEEKNGVMLCETGANCHGTKAHGPNAKAIREKLKKYINDYYSNTNI